ncbi:MULTISPECIES: ParA family protein [Trueperella]|uniref:ParA family protein n=1 Tax=Trueperella TaxID=1069494 RepID=UPI0010116044|nr:MULTISPECIES: ParA family protein [Trueperella]QTG75367.1 ParA family protein [Trueperella pecoris]
MIIAVCNQKGGVGKTTLSTNLAHLLSNSGETTLLVDADPQGNATTVTNVRLGSSQLTLNDVLAAIATGASGDVARQAICPSSEHRTWNIDVLPSDRLLASRESDTSLGRESRLATMSSAMSTSYDHIVIDCPPSLGMLTTNALVAADVALIVTTTREASFDGVAEMVNTIATVRAHYNPRLRLSGIAVNEWRPDRTDRQEWARALREHYGRYLIEPFIPEREAIARAASAHEPIATTDDAVIAALTAITTTLKDNLR